MDSYAIYLRKSRADLEAERYGEGETLARHKKILTELAVKKGMYVGEIYQEIVSGETIESRPQIQRLMNDCYAGKYKGIIVIEITRLSRGNQGDAQQIMDCLKYSNNNSGLVVVTPTKTYDIVRVPEDEEYMEFELFMSRREYKMIKKRMERGRIQSVVEGNYMGSNRPYGYDIVKTKVSRTLEPRLSEAKYVKMMFELAAYEQYTPGKIARRLNALGAPVYRGNEWVLSSVKSILTNPVYMGKVRWNDRMSVKNMVDGKLVTTRPRSNHTEQYMLYEGKHEGIVSQELFELANKRFYSDKTKANMELKNPFASILVCSRCKLAMVYNGYVNRKTNPRIVHKSSEICKMRSCWLTDVEAAVIESLKMYIEDFTVKIEGSDNGQESKIKEEIDIMYEEINKIERKITRLFDAWEDETITNNEFVTRKAAHLERIENIKSQISELELSIPDVQTYKDMVVTFKEALDMLYDQNIKASVKNKFLKSFIKSIEYTKIDDNLVLNVILA